jgi:ankyrin repeat protein
MSWNTAMQLHLYYCRLIFPSPPSFIQSTQRTSQANAAGYTALHVAAAASANECVALLLNNGALVDTTDIFGNTALHITLAAGDSTDCVLRLLTARADPNLCNADGNTALHIAALHNRSNCVQQLLQHGGDPSILNVYGLSAYAVALRMSASFSQPFSILLHVLDTVFRSSTGCISLLQCAVSTASSTLDTAPVSESTSTLFTWGFGSDGRLGHGVEESL